jgi:hypothetical protein
MLSPLIFATCISTIREASLPVFRMKVKEICIYAYVVYCVIIAHAHTIPIFVCESKIVKIQLRTIIT